MFSERAKYIIFDKRLPVIFHPAIVHSEVKAGYYAGKPTSAGFVTLVPIGGNDSVCSKINATVDGESVSLGLKSNGDEDNKLIEKLLNNF